MYLRLLFEEMDGADPEIRFFLISYLLWYGHGGSVERKVRGMASDFGVTDRVVKRALLFLTEKGYLQREKLVTKARGRPISQITVGERLIVLINKLSGEQRAMFHAPLIYALFEHKQYNVVIPPDNPDDPERWKDVSRKRPIPSQTLKVSGRLLLSVLLAHADQMGVVKGISMVDLRSVTGLNQVQLRGHLKVLKLNTYLLHYIPGGAIKKMKGKVTSVFFLDLDWHHNWQVRGLTSVVYDSQSLHVLKQAAVLASVLKATYGYLAQREFRRKCLESEPYWVNTCQIEKIYFRYVIKCTDYFLSIVDKPGEKIKRLNTLMTDLVAKFLLAKPNGMLTDEELNGHIAENISKSYQLPDSSKYQQRVFTRFVRYLVSALYKETKGALSTVLWGSGRIAKCVIYPVGLDGQLVLQFLCEESVVYIERPYKKILQPPIS